MEFRQAKPGEEKQIMEIIDQARAYLKNRGIDQWQKGYPAAEDIREDISRECCYVLLEGSRLLASAVITLAEEAAYRTLEGGTWLNSSRPYGTLHRVAVAETAKGRGLAGRIVAEAARLCRDGGAASLRCDTHEENRSMRRMLEKNGFSCRGVIYLLREGETGARRIAYEKLL